MGENGSDGLGGRGQGLPSLPGALAPLTHTSCSLRARAWVRVSRNLLGTSGVSLRDLLCKRLKVLLVPMVLLKGS